MRRSAKRVLIGNRPPRGYRRREREVIRNFSFGRGRGGLCTTFAPDRPTASFDALPYHPPLRAGGVGTSIRSLKTSSAIVTAPRITVQPNLT